VGEERRAAERIRAEEEVQKVCGKKRTMEDTGGRRRATFDRPGVSHAMGGGLSDINEEGNGKSTWLTMEIKSPAGVGERPEREVNRRGGKKKASGCFKA